MLCFCWGLSLGSFSIDIPSQGHSGLMAADINHNRFITYFKQKSDMSVSFKCCSLGEGSVKGCTNSNTPAKELETQGGACIGAVESKTCRHMGNPYDPIAGPQTGEIPEMERGCAFR